MSYPSRSLQEIVEYRGVEGLVAAEVLVDDNETNTAGTGVTPNHGYVTGDVFAIAGVAEISKTTDSSSEAHYYDNIPAVVVNSMSSDEITISASALPMDVYATLTGQVYDATTGALIEGIRDVKYFAIGYITKKTNGDEVYVWRYKGTFNEPDQTNVTEDDGTDANGQELVFTGISTTHKFTKTGKGAKAINVDTSKELANVSNFFDTVTTPDTLAGNSAYTLTITQASNTTVTVTRNGVALATGATIYQGDALTISVTGGTVTVNSTDWISGDTHNVTGNVAVVSTASA